MIICYGNLGTSYIYMAFPNIQVWKYGGNASVTCERMGGQCMIAAISVIIVIGVPDHN